MSIRLLMLPLQKINHFLPIRGRIYDIGCGGGEVSQFLAIASQERKIIGIDINMKKILKARQKYRLPTLSFIHADILTYIFKQFQGAVLSDFLHHLSYKNQEKLLKKLAKSMTKDGILVIKEIDKGDLIRAALSRIWDFILYPQDIIFYRTRTEWNKLLGKMGFKVSTNSEIIWFPGSTTLFVCTKK